ncbi:MAG: hypothetical protein V4662_20890 [Verrucomicrobiota bacterium]
MGDIMEGEQRDLFPEPGGLPSELHAAARTLEKSLADNHNLQGAFADFCAKAYVRPEWAASASEFIVSSFEDRETELASMARIPDLIIELASGQQALTTTVAFQWAANSDSARLAKLAEALAATQSKIQSAEVVDLMLALATSLAITKYTKAEQMLSLAEPQAEDDHQESLREARLWLAAGRILCGCNQETRDLYEHRLRRRRTPWTWESPVERAALQELADHLHPGQEGTDLFRAIVPTAWWEEAIQRAADRERAEADSQLRREEEEALARAQSQARAYQHLQSHAQSHAHVAPVPSAPIADMQGHAYVHPQSQAAMFAAEPAPVIVWNVWPFFAGGLVGAAALALVIWISPLELKRSVPENDAVAELKAAEPAPDAPPPPQETWRQEEAARLATANTDVQDVHDRIRSSAWADVENLLSGTTPDLPKEDARYVKLLIWLHVDPPQDAEIRNRLPGLLAGVQPDSVTLDLWTKLAYKGSPMEPAIREGARRQIYSNKDAWSATQEDQLSALGWPPTP